MSTADVRRVEALSDFHAALVRYTEASRGHADELTAALSRIETLFADQYPKYWQHELKLADQRFVEARQNLASRERTASGDGATGGTTEARQRMLRCKRRKQFCEDRVRRCREVRIVIEQAIAEVAGPKRQLSNMAETHLPAAATTLANIIEQLKRYQSG